MRLKASIFCFLLSMVAHSQCAMCRAVLETEEGSAKAEAVNNGILYLMAFPYMLIGVIGYIIYKNRKRAAAKSKLNHNKIQ